MTKERHYVECHVHLKEQKGTNTVQRETIVFYGISYEDLAKKIRALWQDNSVL